MCDTISVWVGIKDHAIHVGDGVSHSWTEGKLKIPPETAREAEWKRGGELEVRTIAADGATAAKRLRGAILSRFKTREKLADYVRREAVKSGVIYLRNQADADELPEETDDRIVIDADKIDLGRLRRCGGDIVAGGTRKITAKALTSIGGDADFGSLTDAAGLAALTSIGGDAYFGSLTDAAGLAALTSIGGYADFRSLTDAARIALMSRVGK